MTRSLVSHSPVCDLGVRQPLSTCRSAFGPPDQCTRLSGACLTELAIGSSPEETTPVAAPS
jgi:hypothetical protein